jgi:hypothetical protein
VKNQFIELVHELCEKGQQKNQGSTHEKPDVSLFATTGPIRINRALSPSVVYVGYFGGFGRSNGRKKNKKKKKIRSKEDDEKKI